MLKTNFIKDKLEAGETVLGTWSVIPSMITTDIIASTGLDFIILDREHGPINFETFQQQIIACESRSVSPIIRVSNANEAEILKALDIGVHGIQVPNINCAEQVKSIIQYAYYPPLGNRGFSPFTRSGNYSIENGKTLTAKANSNILTAINLEDIKGVESVESIIEIEKLDIIFIGLFDLSKSIGRPGEIQHPEVLSILKILVQKISVAGKVAGTIATTKKEIEYFKSIGIKYIVYLVDCDVLRSSYANIVNFTKSLN